MVSARLVLALIISGWALQGCTHYNIMAATPDLDDVKRVWAYCSGCVKDSACAERQECDAKTMSKLPDAFYKAVYAQRLDVVRYLVEVAGLDVNARGLNPLQSAAYYYGPKKHEILKYLIERGANVNAISDGPARTPLLTAIWKKNTPGARLLLANGADPSIKSDRGWDACMFAHRWSHWEIMPDLPGCCAKFLDKRWEGDPDEARVRPPELLAACKSTASPSPKR